MTEEDQLIIARNDLHQGSRKNLAFGFCEKIINFLSELFLNTNPDFSGVLTFLLQNYQTQKHYTLSSEQKEKIALAVIEKFKLSHHFNISIIDLKEFKTITLKSEAGSLFFAGFSFLRSINVLKKVLQTPSMGAFNNKLKLILEKKNYLIVRNESSLTHAEVRIISYLINIEKNDQNIGYLGISKLTCLHCSSVIELLNLLGYSIQTRKNVGHGKNYK